jgi:phenylalanyl-tRNA synthetase alpha chain
MSSDPRKQLEDLLLDKLFEVSSISDSVDFLSSVSSLHSAFDAPLLEAVLTSLKGFEFVVLGEKVHTSYSLTAEGTLYAANGSPEGQVFQAIGESGIAAAELQNKIGKDISQVGCGQLMKTKRIQFDKASQMYRRVESEFKDEVMEQLKSIQAGNGEAIDKALVQNLKTRKLIVVG